MDTGTDAVSSGSEYAATALRTFASAGIAVLSLSERRYPDEHLLIVSVPAESTSIAGQVAAQLNATFAASGDPVLTTVRGVAAEASVTVRPMPEGVRDARAIALRQLISARSRTSEVQGSVSYIPDSSMNIDAVVAPRHQLILGRRGAGKTALLLESKRLAESQGHRSVWVNVQTFRLEPLDRLFLYIVRALLETIASESNLPANSPTTVELQATIERVRSMLAKSSDLEASQRLIPDLNSLVKRSLAASSMRINLFLDDFYYVGRADQPIILDMLHSCIRDADCWLKIASIRNLTKWFITSPPTGLETGQDADIIDLDITLQDPEKAKTFLEKILVEYAERVGAPSLTSIFSKSSLDRLTLASGGVPRDYLVLAGASIVRARERDKARVVGVQDVNQVAGDAAQVKIQELEEDGSANKGVPEQASQALLRLRAFCIQETTYTYFRVRHQDRDSNPEAFAVLNRLVEFRLLHSIYASVSNPHKAGDASEVFMLDLSQFTGSRLKQKLWVLDLSDGHLVSMRTRDSSARKVAHEARDLIAILRSAPEFPLVRLSDLVATYDSVRLDLLKTLRPGITRTQAELVSELQAPFRQVVLTLDELVSTGVVQTLSVEGREVYQLALRTSPIQSE
jgi:hypothetical protein